MINNALLQMAARGGRSTVPDAFARGAQQGNALRQFQQEQEKQNALAQIAQTYAQGGPEAAIQTAGQLGQFAPAMQLQQQQAAQQAAQAKANAPVSPFGKLKRDLDRGFITPDVYRAKVASIGKGGVNIYTGKIPLAKKTISDAQKGIVSGRIERIGLGDIRKNFDPSFLTFGGKAANIASGLIDKTGFGAELPESGPLSKTTLKKQTKFKQSVQQTFNRYRKEITGAAAAVQELASLQKALFNLDQSPIEFEAALDNYEAAANRIDELRIELLQEGIDPATPEGGKMLDDAFLGAVQPSPQKRLRFNPATGALE